MTDRELLEQAAKAAGFYWRTGADFEVRLSGGTWEAWNPLTDDGDALRLAVKLRIGLAGSESHVWAFKLDMCDIHEPRGSDSYAATRRAIVRAAASLATSDEIGRNKA